MADHLISLSSAREAALQTLLDAYNSTVAEPITADELLRLWVLEPIKAQIRRARAAESQSLQTAFEAATSETQAQVRALLGL